MGLLISDLDIKLLGKNSVYNTLDKNCIKTKYRGKITKVFDEINPYSKIKYKF